MLPIRQTERRSAAIQRPVLSCVKGTAMVDYRTHALILFEIGEKADLTEHKMQAVAIAQMWLTLAALADAHALRMDRVKRGSAIQ
jgi:hypothetical protein